MSRISSSLRSNLRISTFHIAIISIFLSSCLGIGNGSKTGKAFETYYVGEGINQYFVSALKFKSDNHKLESDFTYRDKNDSVTCNFSIFGSQPFVDFEKVAFSDGTKEVTLNQINKIFIEKQKGTFHSRYTSQIALEDFVHLFHYQEIIPIVSSKGKTIQFEANGKSKKAIETIESDLISILELEYKIN